MTIKTQLVDSVPAGEDLVRSGDVDALVSGDPGAPQVEVKDQLLILAGPQVVKTVVNQITIEKP